MVKKIDTSERLVRTALELFQKQGYGATGIAEILKAANVNAGSLYYFFPTKEELLLAVLEQYKAMLWPVLLDPVFSRTPDPIERIFGLLNRYRDFLIATDFAFGCPLGNLALEVVPAMPKAQKLIAENFQGWRDAVRQCLDAVSDRFPSAINRARLASFVLTVMEGAVMQSRTYRSLEPFDEAVSQLRDYIDRLVAEAGAPQPHRKLPDDAA